MPGTRTLHVTLPVEAADMVHEKVRSGEYASESEVIAEGLAALASRDAATERWLRDDVGPTYDAYKVAPRSARPIGEAMVDVAARMEALKGGGV